MATITIQGSSDDNVLIEGDVEGCDEYGFNSGGEWGYLVLSDGCVFRIAYCPEGIDWWTIRAIQGTTSSISIEQPNLDANDYTEVATVVGDFNWVHWIGPDEDLAKRFARIAGTTPSKLDKAKAIIKCLDSRGGFDRWWHDIDTSDKADILCALAEL